MAIYQQGLKMDTLERQAIADRTEGRNQLRFEFLDALTKSAIDPALQSHEYQNVPQVPEPTPGLLLWLGVCSLIQFRGKQLASLSNNT